MKLLPENTVLGRLSIVEVYHYYDGPKLFACSNVTGQLYLTFWLGEYQDYDRWMYLPVSETRLTRMRSGGMSLRHGCRTPENGYLWIAQMPFTPDGTVTVEAVFPEQIDEMDMPSETAFLKYETQTLSELESISLRAERTACEVLDLSIKTRDDLRNEIKARTLGNALVETQELIESMLLSQQGFKSRKGRVPPNLKERAELKAVGVFPASFGIRLESKEQADMFGDSVLTSVLNNLVSLFEAGSDSENLTALLSEMGSRVAARYSAFLKVISNSKANITVKWATPKSPDEVITLSKTSEEADRIAEVLIATIDEYSETFKIWCLLEGINVHTRLFDLVNMESGERLRGQVAISLIDTAEDASTRVPAYYTATIEQRQEITGVTGEIKEKYVLIDLIEGEQR